MPTVSELVARVTVIGVDEASAKLQAMSGETDAAGAKFSKLAVLGTTVLAAGLAIVAAKSAQMAGNFEQSTNTLITSAGLQRNAIDAVRQGILQMAIDTGTGTDQLVKGMFNVQSALHLGAGGLQVLKAAAEGAKAENSDLAQTTDVLTTAMVNYHLGAQQAVGTMNSLIVTVANGKMHMNDLTGSLKNVLPISAALKVQLSDVEGALATMANAGDRGTSAGTHLAMMLKMLANPASTARNEMAAMGLDSDKLAQTMRTSLPGALQMIQDAVAQHFTPGSVQYNRAIQTILGGSKSGIAGLELFGQGLKQLGVNTRAASDALHKGGKDVENWDTIQSTFNFKMDKAKEVVEAFMIKLGTGLLPILGRLLDVVPTIANYFSNFSQHANVLIPIMAGLGAILVAVLVPAVWSLAAGVIAATWPLLAIGAAVAGLVALFMHFYQTNTGFKTFIDNLVNGFKQLWSMIQANFMPTMQRLGAFFQSTILPVLQQVGSFIVGTFKPAWDQLVTTWKQNLLPGLQMLWGLFQQLWPVLKIVGIVLIASVVVPILAVIAVLVLIGVAIMKFVALLIQGWALAISFTGAAFSAIGTTITNFKNLVGNIFNTIGTFIHDKLTWIYNHNYYVKAFVDRVNKFLSDLKQIVSTVFAFVADWIGSRLDYARRLVEGWVQAAINKFNELKSQATAAIQNMTNTITSTIGGLIGNAFSWGANLIQGFINGIGSMLGGVQQAAQNVVSTVANLLGFHSPAKEGPGRDADKWMPNLMNMFTQGIIAGTPSMQRALSGILSPIGTSLSVNATGSYTPFASGAALARSTSNSSNGASNQPIVLVMDGRAVARGLMPHITNQIRNATGVRF